jgi:type IV pilus assembly protein PilZ
VSEAQSSPGGILNVAIKDKAALYEAYMPFVRNGGLFYPTIKPYRMGDEVLLLLTLMDDSERIAVAARVVWITPVGAQNRRRAGIGVQFSAKDGGATQKRIEVHLAGAVDSERSTLTL